MVTIMFWASGFVFTGVANNYYSPFTLAFLRMSAASVVLIIVGIIMRVGLPKLKDIPLFLTLGATGFSFYITALNKAMQTITAATAGIMTATVPIMAAVFSSLFLKEKLKPLQWIAVALEFIGIVILNWDNGEFSIVPGFWLMVVAAISFTAYNLLMRKATTKYSATQSTIYSIVASALLLSFVTPMAIREVTSAPLDGLAVVLYLGTFPSAFGFLLWTKAISLTKKLSNVTNFMFVTPLLAALLDIVVTGTISNTATVIGGIVVITGLILFNRFRKD